MTNRLSSGSKTYLTGLIYLDYLIYICLRSLLRFEPVCLALFFISYNVWIIIKIIFILN